jgi:hypothetical protein
MVKKEGNLVHVPAVKFSHVVLSAIHPSASLQQYATDVIFLQIVEMPWRGGYFCTAS